MLNSEVKQMSRKEKFDAVLKKHGYRSLNNFCIENKLIQTNVNRRVKHEDIQVELPILFSWANILHEPIDTLIEIFYPNEYQENRSLIED